MSLSIFIHRKLPEVGIVRWFRDSRGSIDFASGPPVQMSLKHFREFGYDWVHLHFQDYVNIRLLEARVVPVFQPGEAKKLMRDRSVVEIKRDPDGNLIFSPKGLRKYGLAYFETLDKEFDRTIPEKSPSDLFWNTFDEVLAIACEA